MRNKKPRNSLCFGVHVIMGSVLHEFGRIRDDFELAIAKRCCPRGSVCEPCDAQTMLLQKLGHDRRERTEGGFVGDLLA